MSNPDLPADVSEILEYIGRYAEGYDGHMKWNEEAKLKADMMNMRHRWERHRVGHPRNDQDLWMTGRTHLPG